MSLSDFAIDPAAPKAKAVKWTPPDDVVRCKRVALCFDQTLSKVGWSILKPLDGCAMVWQTGLFEPHGDPAAGFKDDFARCRSLFIEVLSLIERYAPLLVLHETPSVGIKGRTTSSLLAAATINCAAENVGLPVAMFQRQHVAKALTDDGKASKAQVKEVVLRIWPELKTRKLRLGTDVTDSIGGGLVWMKEND